MKAIVIGAGVVGVNTAYQLAKLGVQVTVVDRADDVAQETSAVNAGLLASGHTFTWASPKALGVLARSLRGAETAMRLHYRIDPELWAWGLKFLRNCPSDRAAINTLRRLKLSQYSRDVLEDVLTETGIDFDENRNGALFLYRDAAAFKAGIERLKPLGENGEAQKILGPDEVVQVEPALGPVKSKIAGAVFSPTTISGDSSKFSRGLAEKARELGVVFKLGTKVSRFVVSGGRIQGIQTDLGLLTADRYVLAGGIGSKKLAKTAGLNLSIYPIKGYTMTTPIQSDTLVPTVSGIDENLLVAWSRFGDRIRMTGTADFAGYDTRLVEKDARSIFQSGQDLFPNSFRWEDREMRVGLRPVTPDENPLIGATNKYPELILNTGHGNLGWVMAAGSGKLAAQIATGTKADLDARSFEAV